MRCFFALLSNKEDGYPFSRAISVHFFRHQRDTPAIRAPCKGKVMYKIEVKKQTYGWNGGWVLVAGFKSNWVTHGVYVSCQNIFYICEGGRARAWEEYKWVSQ